jgi:predicted TIM-barrel fold metal-dependent hydrolase
MWANDHPHSDATWPNSQAVVTEQTRHLDPEVRDDILWRNCARLYGLEVTPGP